MRRLTKILTARVSPELREKFVRKSEEYGGSSVVLRELVAGYVDGRVTIKPPKEGIYNAH